MKKREDNRTVIVKGSIYFSAEVENGQNVESIRESRRKVTKLYSIGKNGLYMILKKFVTGHFQP